MERREFILKTLIASGAAVTGADSILEPTTTKQKFNFMTTSHPNLTLINDFFQAYAKSDLDGIKKNIRRKYKMAYTWKASFKRD